MSIIKWCQAGPPEGESKTSSVNAYRIPVTVWCDDANDDAGLVIFYLKNTAGYLIGSSYVQPNYTDTFSVVKRITANKRRESADPWIFDCYVIYEPAVPNVEQEDENGQLQEDPLLWRYDITSGFVQEQLPVWAAVNIDAYPKDDTEAWSIIRAANTKGAVINSAGVTLDPPLMRTRSVRFLRISGNLNQYNEAWLENYQDHINAAGMWYSSLLYSSYGFATKQHKPWEVLCSAALATYQRTNNIGYYRYTYEFRFKERDPNFYPTVSTPYGPSPQGDGWLEHVLDMGIGVRTVPGAPDGEGGVIPGSPGSSVMPGRSETSVAKDTHGKRIAEKVLFDGNGLPARSSGSLAPEGVWFRYRKHDEVIMTGHPLNIFQADDPSGP